MNSTDLSSVTPGKVHTQKELVLLETSTSEFHEKITLDPFKNWHFVCHVCIFLECITVAISAVICLNVGSNNTVFDSGVIMKSG